MAQNFQPDVLTTERRDTTRHTLEALPAEILIRILYYSAEPSLLHVSMCLYKRLPPYKEFTRQLAIRALAPFWYLYTPEDPDQDIDKLRTLGSSANFRENVFYSNWFSYGLIRAAHKAILHYTIRKALLYIQGLNKQHERKLDRYIQRLYTDSLTGPVRWICPKGEVYATPLQVEVKRLQLLLRLPVLNFGGLPLLILTPDSTKRIVLDEHLVERLRDVAVGQGDGCVTLEFANPVEGGSSLVSWVQGLMSAINQDNAKEATGFPF